jgi:ABC-type glycerol-3-phosphate transport system substrate-binding protein
MDGAGGRRRGGTGSGTVRRRFVRGAAVAPLAALVACARQGATDSAPPAALSAKPVKIELATDWSTPQRQPVMDAMRDEFVKAHPQVTVNNQYIGGAGGSAEGYSERTVAQLVAGTAPDVIANWAFNPYVDQLADLTRDAPAAGWKQAEVVFDPFNQQVGGKLYMLSMSTSVSGWCYNKSLFQGAALKEPDDGWTLNDVFDAAQKLTRRDQQQYGIDAVNSVWFGWLEPLWAAGAGSTGPTGAEMFSLERKKSRLAEAGGADAFDWYAGLIHRHHVAPTADEARENGISFNAGKIGMRPISIYSSGGAAQAIGSNFVWSAMPIPRDPATKKRAYDLNSEGFVIPRVTRDRGTYDAALRYVLTFYSDPVMKAVAQLRSTLPVMRKWIESPEYLSAPPLNLDVIVKTLNDKQVIVGDHGARYKPFPAWLAAVRAELNKAFTGENTPRPALAAAMMAGDQVLSAS